MSESVLAFIALGANLGDPVATVQQAIARIASLPELKLVKASGLYRSAPIDSDGPDYINAVMSAHVPWDAPYLLKVLHKLERDAGRERPYPNAPRTLDLDLLFYGDSRMDSAALQLPHPRWTERAFVVLPLAEIAPERVSVEQLAAVRGQQITRLPG
jgi:2-amino-4-hydroxy-6-hydroxymethyldihydropteridine diphosphokinase